jgi:hypothetical protein
VVGCGADNVYVTSSSNYFNWNFMNIIDFFFDETFECGGLLKFSGYVGMDDKIYFV